jgi:hypothetical protein
VGDDETRQDEEHVNAEVPRTRRREQETQVRQQVEDGVPEVEQHHPAGGQRSNPGQRGDHRCTGGNGVHAGPGPDETRRIAGGRHRCLRRRQPDLERRRD